MTENGKPDDDNQSDADRRSRMVALLEANHVFPGPFHISVVAHNREGIKSALSDVIRAETGVVPPDDADAWQILPSAQGSYVSHRITLSCDSAQQIVVLFERLFEVDGVIRVL